jgi:acetoin utilization protein AcuC
VLTPEVADDETLGTIHTPGYIAAVRAASEAFPGAVGHGLGTSDNPVFPGMHGSAALIAGGSVAAARAIAHGDVDRAVNFFGGLHHAMPDYASGFCVYNDAALAIRALLDAGVKRVAYVDVDVHHGDGVQTAFYDDPRVLTVSIHETPLSLFPGTGWPSEWGRGDAHGSSVNIALPAGTGDAAWLRAFHAVVPGVVRAFRPEVLVTQQGADAHREDPLADLNLSVDGQRTSYLALRELAESVTGGRWLALGGGGYALVRVVPRAWTHLLGIVAGRDIDPATPLPQEWVARASAARPDVPLPSDMSDGTTSLVNFDRWDGSMEMAVDRAIQDTRNKIYPLHGLDPHDPRD